MIHVYDHLAEKSKSKSQTSAILQKTHEAPAPAAVDPKERYHRIAELAYLRSEHRGFLPGYEIQDWLEAETEVDQPLRPVS
jgi:hypothetical protein